MIDALGGFAVSLIGYIDYDRAVENILYGYSDSCLALENLKMRFMEIEEELKGLSGIRYDRDKIQFQGDPEERRVNLMLEKQDIQTKIKLLGSQIALFRRAWKGLSEEEQTILREFFQKGTRRKQDITDSLCSQMGYEKANIYLLRNKALKRFKFLLTGS